MTRLPKTRPGVLLAILTLAWTSAAAAAPGTALAVEKIDCGRESQPGPTLHIATLNLAHGRGNALNQLLVSGEKTRANLAAVAQFLRDRDIHVAALQEADAPSWWSGGFDHTALVAALGGFCWHASSPHASLGVGSYGTAVVSTLPILLASGHDFPSTPPTARKGFTLAEIDWPATGEDKHLDVISIHMDFSRKGVRQTQLQELRKALADRSNPLVIMGDFNSVEIARQLMREESADGRHLHTAGDSSAPWHSYKDKRLDWILLSDELEFLEYNTYPETLSDHRLVAARVGLRSSPNRKEKP